MVENVENAEKEKPKSTLGFGVTGAPIWLCRELSKEAKRYYNDVYWIVLVDWYRKAKEYENIIRGGMPSYDALLEDKEVEVDEKPKKNEVKLFGGNVGKGGR